MQFLKQSTATYIQLGPFFDNTDGTTPETLLTISQADVRLSKAGAAFAQKTESTSGTHDENGFYRMPLDATDTGTVGRLTVYVTESGALPVISDFTVLPANVYDSLIGGTDYIKTDMTQIEGSDATDTLISVSDILTTAMTESYAADGAAPTLAQALFLIQQAVTEFSISSTTLTVKKLDGSTTAGTFTLDSATTPTSITRAS